MSEQTAWAGYSDNIRDRYCGERATRRLQVRTLEQVAAELGMTGPGVLAVERRALQKCRKWCLRNGFDEGAVEMLFLDAELRGPQG